MKKLFKCSVCGYMHEGEAAPANCPKCGATADKFAELAPEAADKVYRSDFTNSLHMELIGLAENIISLCEEGIEDDLDPMCVRAFQEALNEAWVIKQRSKAELAGHMSKGKW